MGQFLPIVVLAAVAALFAGLSFIASGLLNARRDSKAKVMPYECGIDDLTEPPQRFPVRFYLIAMIFIVFDIEIVFLYPFAMVFRGLGVYGLIAVAIFAFAVFESFLYLIANGALDWGPAKHLRRSELVSPRRTAATTVKRVGLEGRDAEEREIAAAARLAATPGPEAA